jgi:hypothetical protein
VPTHTSYLRPRLACVSDPGDPRVRIQTEQEARLYLSQLIRLAHERTPASFVARELKRSRTTVFSWNHPQSVSLRAHELVLAPRPWALTVARGLLAKIEGSRCGSPSRIELVRVLTRAAELIASARSEDLTSLPTELLRSQVDALRSSRSELEEALRSREAELLRRSNPALPSSSSTSQKGAC